MDDLDRYLYEINRIQKNVNLYHDLFCVDKNRVILNKFNGSVFSIFQKSLNTEIILSVAKAFDTDGYEYKGVVNEYLSQRNLALKYSAHMNEDINKLKSKTTELVNQLNIKNYRSYTLAHNNKPALLGEKKPQKHNIETESLLNLLNASYEFIYQLRLSALNISQINTIKRQKKYTANSSAEFFIAQFQSILEENDKSVIN